MEQNIITNLQLKLNLEREERQRDEDLDIQRIKEEFEREKSLPPQTEAPQEAEEPKPRKSTWQKTLN